ncbi:hypothetical protein [Laspinema palackyanum]|uniref:hypothetical protein n=1 Tax=Laspinema palackyanum TaxID=3231601 RepID=UPI00345C66C7|nr:hypothetical protein [Laspinema sp. D2c]
MSLPSPVETVPGRCLHPVRSPPQLVGLGINWQGYSLNRDREGWNSSTPHPNPRILNPDPPQLSESVALNFY